MSRTHSFGRKRWSNSRITDRSKARQFIGAEAIVPSSLLSLQRLSFTRAHPSIEYLVRGVEPLVIVLKNIFLINSVESLHSRRYGRAAREIIFGDLDEGVAYGRAWMTKVGPVDAYNVGQNVQVGGGNHHGLQLLKLHCLNQNQFDVICRRDVLIF